MWKGVLLRSRRRLRIHLLEGMLLRRGLHSISAELPSTQIESTYLLAGMAVVHSLVM